MHTVGVWIIMLGMVGCASGPLGLQVEVDEDHPSVVHVEFNTASKADSYVRFALQERPEEFEHETPINRAERRHEHLLLGLKAGQPYTYEIVLVRGSGGQVVHTGTVTTEPPPSILPDLTAETLDVSQSQVVGNYVMFAASDGAGGGPYSGGNNFFIGIADHEGDWVWWHLLPQGKGTVNGQPSRDGGSLVWTEYDETRTDPDGRILRMTLDGEVLSETLADGAHHATVELPDGRFAYLSRSFTPMNYGDRGDVAMADSLVINEEGSQTPGTLLFDQWTDWFGGLGGYPVDDGYSRCPTLFQQLYGETQVCEVTHSNSLAYVEDQGKFYMYARILSALLRIDGETGALEGQMGGGSGTDFELPNDELGSKGHFSHIWPGGMVLFDNGTGYDPQVSGLTEYAWTPSSLELRWRYTDPDNGFTNSLGDARKLTGGTYLASWMTMGKITEVSRDKEEVWRMLTGGTDPRRLYLLEDLYDLTQVGSISE
ncbi:MAG: hypothetical protein KTR31_04615 [Myxococcales bacterium]|nr:hypothetical protein [Myxococcales bacterium]